MFTRQDSLNFLVSKFSSQTEFDVAEFARWMNLEFHILARQGSDPKLYANEIGESVLSRLAHDPKHYCKLEKSREDGCNDRSGAKK